MLLHLCSIYCVMVSSCILNMKFIKFSATVLCTHLNNIYVVEAQQLQAVINTLSHFLG